MMSATDKADIQPGATSVANDPEETLARLLNNRQVCYFDPQEAFVGEPMGRR